MWESVYEWKQIVNDVKITIHVPPENVTGTLCKQPGPLLTNNCDLEDKSGINHAVFVNKQTQPWSMTPHKVACGWNELFTLTILMRVGNICPDS